MIVLDTNVLSEIFRPQPDAGVSVWVASLTGGVAITSITLAELLAGVRLLPGKRRRLLAETINVAIGPYRMTESILPFCDRAAEQYAAVVEARTRSGVPMSMADAQIAAICRVRSATLATRNVKDFVGTGIDVIDPWREGRA